MDLKQAKSVLQRAYAQYNDFVPDKLNSAFCEQIEYIILSDHLTFRYMLLTALLAKVVDAKIHMRAVQAGADLQQAYDARSLCHKVIVPFEKTTLKGRLGNSNEPYLNKPARCETIERTNPVRGGKDRELLENLYTLLESLNSQNEKVCKEALVFAMRAIMKRPVRSSENVKLPPLAISSDVIFSVLSNFLKESYDGEAAVAILGAIFHQFYPNEKTVIHPVNEAGSSSNEIGDIDIVFSDKRIYAVEVKDKIFTATDVDHAVGKALENSVNKAIFAYSYNAMDSAVDFKTLISQWKVKGVDLSFVQIPVLLEQIIALQATVEYNSFCQDVLQNLYDMRAKDETIRAFRSILM